MADAHGREGRLACGRGRRRLRRRQVQLGGVGLRGELRLNLLLRVAHKLAPAGVDAHGNLLLDAPKPRLVRRLNRLFALLPCAVVLV
jgi:hypothetical protein